MLSALGGGLVGTALAAGAGGAGRLVLAGLGVAALGWGVLSLRAGRPLAPRAVLATSVAALVVAGVAVASGAMADVPGLPLAAACVFLAVVALSVAGSVRGGLGARRASRASGPEPGAAAAAAASTTETRRSLVGLAIGAVLISALATPALAATEAGRSAVPHGTHSDDAPSAPAHHH